MMTDETDRSYFDSFAGGVPPGEVLRSHVQNLIALADGASDDLIEWHLPELCLIGLHAYFEAFCKDQFSTLINIHPDLIVNLKRRDHDVTVDSTKLLACSANPRLSLGFFLAEKYDFGTAHKINSLYQALLDIAPFSKREVRKYSDMLSDRNLLVHHGGTYTTQYLEQREIPDDLEKYRPHMDSLVISSARVRADGEFLASIARKTVRASHDALKEFLKGRGHSVDGDIESALFMMRWWGDEGA